MSRRADTEEEQDHYDVLGLSSNADAAAVRAAFHAAARRLHPGERSNDGGRGGQGRAPHVAVADERPGSTSRLAVSSSPRRQAPLSDGNRSRLP